MLFWWQIAMEILIRCNYVPLLMLSTAYLTQATIVTSKFKKMEPVQNITGIVGLALKARSRIQCSIRCYDGRNCDAYKYSEHKTENCVLIHRDTTHPDREIFKTNNNGVVYEKTNNNGVVYEKGVDDDFLSGLEFSETWNSPSGWTGPNSVFYRNFDTSDYLVLWKGSQQIDYVPLTRGKMGNAVKTYRSNNQWIDLGIHKEACMTRVDCGEAGGAISVWVNVEDCPTTAGIVSSRFDSSSTGSIIYCDGTTISSKIELPVGYLEYRTRTPPPGWFHIVLNYKRADNQHTIEIYINGMTAFVVFKHTDNTIPHPSANGRLVLGKYFTKYNHSYASVQIDELIYFNQALIATEIETLYNAV